MTREFFAASNQMNEPNLEPCPSCKKYPEVKQTVWGTQYRVVCPNNCIKPELRYTREAAIRLWNRVVGEKKAA